MQTANQTSQPSSGLLSTISAKTDDWPPKIELVGITSDKTKFIAKSGGQLVKYDVSRIQDAEPESLATEFETKAQAVREHIVSVKNPFRWGEFSWAYGANTNGKPSINVQWLRWQGSEYHIEFSSDGDRDNVLLGLIALLTPDYEPTIVDKYTIWARDKYDIDMKLTIDPLRLLELCPDTAQLVLTPTNFPNRQLMYGDNVRKCIDLEVDSGFRVTPENINLLSLK